MGAVYAMRQIYERAWCSQCMTRTIHFITAGKHRNGYTKACLSCLARVKSDFQKKHALERWLEKLEKEIKGNPRPKEEK